MSESPQDKARRRAAETADQSLACLRTAFDLLGVPGTYVDVGCGDGHLVRWAASLGSWAVGLDVGVESAELGRVRLMRHDLTIPVPAEEVGVAEVVTCWEVAEHLPASAADTLCDSLRRLTRARGLLLFTAATPGQGGAGHLNEQPHGYWAGKLRARDFWRETELTRELRAKFSEVAPRAWWYGKNLMVFRG